MNAGSTTATHPAVATMATPAPTATHGEDPPAPPPPLFVTRTGPAATCELDELDPVVVLAVAVVVVVLSQVVVEPATASVVIVTVVAVGGGSAIAGVAVVGVLAAIYHPVGLAIVVQKWKNTGMRIAVNGVWGNLGVASAALVTGYFIDHGGWRTAFVVPGIVSILIGIAYTALMWPEIVAPRPRGRAKAAAATVQSAEIKALLFRVSLIVFLTTAVSSIVFQSTTFALPKVFDERLGGLAMSATTIGQLAFVVFAVGSIGQLIVGHYLDRLGPRTVFIAAAALQVAFFAAMPGLVNWAAVACALVFMLAAPPALPTGLATSQATSTSSTLPSATASSVPAPP